MKNMQPLINSPEKKYLTYLVFTFIVLLGIIHPLKGQKNEIPESAREDSKSKTMSIRVTDIDSLNRIIKSFEGRYKGYEITINLTPGDNYVNNEITRYEGENAKITSEKNRLEELLKKEKGKNTILVNDNSYNEKQIKALREIYIRHFNIIGTLETEKRVLLEREGLMSKELRLLKAISDSLIKSVSDLGRTNYELVDIIRTKNSSINIIENKYDSLLIVFVEQRRKDSISMRPAFSIAGEIFQGWPLSASGPAFSRDITGFSGMAGILFRRRLLTAVGTGFNIYNGGNAIPLFVEFRYSFNDKKLNPYVFGRGGGLINLVDTDFSNIFVHYGLGIWQRMNRSFAVSLSTGLYTHSAGIANRRDSFILVNLGIIWKNANN